MGRYYDDKISSAGLDPANPYFGPLASAAESINRAENEFYKNRRDLFKELNNGDSVGNKDQVEAEYAKLHSGLNVYEFLDKFNEVDPDRRSANGGSRYVHVPYELTTFEAGFADLYQRGEEDDDGDSQFELADDVLDYQKGQGKVQIDTLYKNVRAFTSNRTVRGYFEQTEDADGDEDYDSVTVYAGFGEVPIRWVAKSGYTAQDLQVMNIAGRAYEEEVGPKIDTYKERLRKYEENGGGPLISDFYEGTPDFPYEGFIGTRNSYNRPQALSARLIDQARGFLS